MQLSFRPGPPLNEFVDHFWLIENGQAPRLEKILPSGTIELVVNLKHNEIHIHDPEQPDRFQRFDGAVFSGTYSRSFVCNASQHEAMIGVHFRPGGAFPFLVIEASELTNTHANVADLWGKSALELRERLCTASTSQRIFHIMEDALRDRLRYHSTDDLEMKIALQMFARGGVGSRDVSQELGFSQRRFIQLFNSHVGLTPKVFCRIQRFQRARVLAEKFATPHWAELAVTCGYFDQSHLIKDFHEFAGSTPKTYSEQQHHKDARLKDNHVPLAGP
jgi:AraC-like DNA-binding protein